MASNPTPSDTVLLVHRDGALAQSLAVACDHVGLTLRAEPSPEEALRLLSVEPPDIAVVEATPGSGKGLWLAGRIKRDSLLAAIPVIALFSPDETSPLSRIPWEDAPFDDYVIGVGSPRDLVGRIRLNLCRSRRSLDANPLTRLPGNSAITRELERRISRGEEFAVCHFDLDQFKAFNDRYGFARGDEALRQTARLLVDVAMANAPANSFVGHLGGDDFVAIIPVDLAQPITAQIIGRFDRLAASLCDEEDRARGHFLGKNRHGETERIPLMTMSIAVIPNTKGRLRHIGQISGILAELKRRAKEKESGSSVVFDRREAPAR